MPEFTYSDVYPTSLPEIIETNRLRLQSITPDSITPKELYDLITKGDDVKETTQYVTFSQYDTIKDAEQYVKQSYEDWKNGEKAVYIITVKEMGVYAGTTSFTPRWHKKDATFGIWLRKRYWGNGYSPERGEAFLELAFNELGLEFVEVCAATGNKNSHRAIKKYIINNGGKNEGLLRHYIVSEDGEVFDVERYTINRDEWNGR